MYKYCFLLHCSRKKRKQLEMKNIISFRHNLVFYDAKQWRLEDNKSSKTQRRNGIYISSSSSSSPSSAVASWYCWYSETRSFMLDSASVNSISSIPSPVYQ